MRAKGAELYRQFSNTGKLLYVGVSLSALMRLREHKGSSRWFKHIGRLEVERFATRRGALAAERRIIQTEQPRWNVHQKKKIPAGLLEAVQLPENDDQVLTFQQWIQVNWLSETAGRRILKSGACEYVQLSPRRIGITVGANRRYQSGGRA
jgi:hypothetical protein